MEKVTQYDDVHCSCSCARAVFFFIFIYYMLPFIYQVVMQYDGDLLRRCWTTHFKYLFISGILGSCSSFWFFIIIIFWSFYLFIFLVLLVGVRYSTLCIGNHLGLFEWATIKSFWPLTVNSNYYIYINFNVWLIFSMY